jgi:hypothetical protein
MKTAEGDDYWLFAGPGGVVIDLGKDESAELKKLLNRALNTLEPVNYPKWAIELADMLE